MSGFFDLPVDMTCIHPEHEPPSGLYIPPGKGYRHVCPGCGNERTVIPASYTLGANIYGCNRMESDENGCAKEKE